ncbi:hypothetical protein FRB94_000802 [Tulasnella sp. JGI-2019a]|nr:hypothetical protein FRB94_000802 [Tulasnella sp. JGI-2019a]
MAILPQYDTLVSTYPVTLWVSALGLTYIAHKSLKHLYSNHGSESALRWLPGPKPASFLLGNLGVIRTCTADTLDQWLRDYGPTFTSAGFLRRRELFVIDLKALAFIYNQPLMFSKPPFLINVARSLVGDGLLTVEGLVHRKQRKVMNPAFSMAHIRELTPLMTRHAKDLKDIWLDTVSKSTSGTAEIEVSEWLNRAALNIIGDAGFGYQFNALHDSSNELAMAFHDLQSTFSMVDLQGVLSMFFPILGRLPTARNKLVMRSKATMARIGMDMIERKKAEAEKLGEIDPRTLGKDLLSVLIRSNMKENPAEKLNDDAVLAVIATFILGGHETVATATSWGLYALAKAPAVQSKLRGELLAFPSDAPTMDELNGLPYLDNVVKEILRLHAPVAVTRRTPLQDTMLPLATPVINKEGKEVHEIFIRAGDSIVIHNRAGNTRADLWGPTAHEFIPERFENLPDTVSEVPTLYGNTLSFNYGARGCIGWRMAVLEVKALLFALVRTFNFDIDPTLRIAVKMVLAARPVVVGEEDKGPQLPLRVSLYKPVQL